MCGQTMWLTPISALSLISLAQGSYSEGFCVSETKACKDIKDNMFEKLIDITA